jgi:putative Mn2+ efflux pump MntP
MSIVEIVLLAISLSMDAFAVALCKGLALKKINLKNCAIVGLWFGAFQGLMPLLGYFLGISFADCVTEFDHWISFVLLGIIGGKMIKESLGDDSVEVNPDFSFKTMLALAVATSIDALAVGVSFAFLKVDIWLAVLLIGVTTAAFSGVGILIGNRFGAHYKSKAEFAGGVILVLIGVKILIQHLMS